MLDHRKRTWALLWEVRPDQHRERCFHCVGEVREPFNSQCRSERAKLRDLSYVEVTTVFELPLQLVAGKREAVKLGGLELVPLRQFVDGRHQRLLIGGELEVHARGSRGSLSSSVAIRLSCRFTQLAPEAIPATTARW